MRALLFIIIPLFFSGCFCGQVDCLGPETDIDLVLHKNGVNLLFGPEAILDPAEVQLSSELGFDRNLSSRQNIGAITLWLIDGIQYELILPGADTLMLQAKAETLPGKCCDRYEATEVTIDGITVCSGLCTTVVYDIN